MTYPPSLQCLIQDFASLPGIGQKTAERIVFHLLKNNQKTILSDFGRHLATLLSQIKKCPLCGNYIDSQKCSICHDTRRDSQKICLVAEASDIITLEKTGAYHGLYHVLHGLLDPSQGVTPEQLNLNSFYQRLNQKTEEIIFGFNPTMEGESTIIYLKKIITDRYPHLRLTKLSRGLPMGADLEYADGITLMNALNNRFQA